MNKEKVRGYLESLCKGKKKLISSSDLESATGLSGNEVRKQINRLRREGIPIASNRYGYFYAETAAEVYATIRNLEKMRRGLDAAIRGLEEALDSFGDAS